MADEWKHGFCSCKSKSGGCGKCCPCDVYKTKTAAERIGESSILYGLLTCFLPCIVAMLMIRRIRKRYNIEGSVLEDASLSCFCTPCILCQNSNEANERERNYIKAQMTQSFPRLQEWILNNKYVFSHHLMKKIHVYWFYAKRQA